jgi:septal ring-binding cell division protein DamX
LQYRGLLTSVQPGSAFVSAPVPYIAAHNTSPPPNQIVKTDPTSLLIKSLQSRKAKEEPKKKKPAARQPADKGKRPAEATADEEGSKPAKKGPAASIDASGAGPSNASAQAAGPSMLPPSETEYTIELLSKRTIKDLQAILKAWSLPISGKKDELCRRIFEQQELSQGKR